MQVFEGVAQVTANDVTRTQIFIHKYTNTWETDHEINKCNCIVYGAQFLLPVSICELRAQSNGLFIVRYGCIQLSFISEYASEIAPCDGEVGSDADGFQVTFLSGVQITLGFIEIS